MFVIPVALSAYTRWSDHRALEARRVQLRTDWKERQENTELQAAARERVAAQQAKDAVKKDANSFDSEEIQAFREKIKELDPEGVLIQSVDIEDGDGIVLITGTSLAYSQSDLALKELGASMRDAASKICECSAGVLFKTEGGQTVMTANTFGVDIKVKDR